MSSTKRHKSAYKVTLTATIDAGFAQTSLESGVASRARRPRA